MGNKLELTWYGKDKPINVEPRVLIENPNLSNISKDPNTQNMLIHGDNLLALKALEAKFAGKIKCIYIDPPYNTGNAFNNYDDNLEHSIWLNLMNARLTILRKLLADDGCIFIQINDDEASYLRVLCDEIFGRHNYETTFYVKVRHENRILRKDTRWQLCIEQVLMYRKTGKFTAPRRTDTKNPHLDYKYDIELLNSPVQKIKIGIYDVDIFKSDSYKITKKEPGEGKFKQYQIRGSLITQKGSASEYYEMFLRTRREKDGLGTLYKVNGMGINGDGLGYRYIMQPEKAESKNGFYFQATPKNSKEDKGLPYPNFYDETLVFNNAGYEGYGYFNGGKKPEEWIKFLIELSGVTKNDFILDSFLGSGTTAAVAIKSGFNFIGIELGNHAYELCKPRLDMVINDKDKYGVKKETSHIGYRFYELAPTLIKTDAFGQAIINPQYNADMLASAIALHEGYQYNPDKEVYWKQSSADNNSYLYVTTTNVNRDMVDSISQEMKEDETLLIVCKSFVEGCCDDFKNISIKKIPQSILNDCEYDKDNYNLNIVNPPVYEDAFEEDEEKKEK